MKSFHTNPLQLFSDYMRLTGVPSLDDEQGPDPELSGKSLGVINGASWVNLWSTYFGKLYLPGVKIINVGNEAIQLSFMRAHARGEACPPQENIESFCHYAWELADYSVNAILITCSTMNRAFPFVSERIKDTGIPIIQIDVPLMEKAVQTGKRILVVATHGPTVDNTSKLLHETAVRCFRNIETQGILVEKAFQLLGQGLIREHNEHIAHAIRRAMASGRHDVAVLAQLSMSTFSFSYPRPETEFGIPILNSAETGFQRARDILRGLEHGKDK